MKISALLVFLLFILSAEVSAVGLSPARVDLPFKPGFKYEVPFEVFSSYDMPSTIYLNYKGDLNEYVKLSDMQFEMEPRSSKTFKVYIELPEKPLHPGGLGIFISAYEKPKSSFSGINAFSQVTAMIRIDVPYPGKYLETSISANDVGENEDVNILLSAANKGKEPISSVEGRIEVSDENANKIKEIPVTQFSLEPEEKKDITNTFSIENITPGTYTVVAVLNYDGTYTTATDSFKAGVLLAKIVNATTELAQGKINKFDIFVENKWNNVIPGLYAEITLLAANKEALAKVKTPSIDLQPFETKPIVTYIDTADIAAGTYDAKIELFYSGKKTTENIKINIRKKIALNPLSVIIAVIALIILIDLIVIMRRKMHNHTKRAKINARL